MGCRVSSIEISSFFEFLFSLEKKRKKESWLGMYF